MRLSAVLVLFTIWPAIASGSSFRIEDDRFLKDDQPLQLISGSVHYHRFLPQYWRDRLLRVRALGCNSIQFLVPWNFHEPQPGKYVWDGNADLAKFINLAAELDLNVLLRLGPYICGEWDFGGFPWWLATSQVPGGGKFALRTNDSQYLDAVDGWFRELLPRVKPHLYPDGPIVMVQIENELGFVDGPDNAAYLRHLWRLTRSALGNDILIYTTDPPPIVAKGSLPGEDVYTVVDFGAGWYDLDYAFGQQRTMNAPGKSPPFCSELYTGWLTLWGQPMANVSSLPPAGSADPHHDVKFLIGSLNAILQYANGTGNVNFYMAFGGTNFAYWQGGGGSKYNGIITSYDYDSPISEAGDYGQPGIGGVNKFKLIRDAVSAHTGVEPPPPPPRPAIHSYGSVKLDEHLPLLGQLASLSRGVASDSPRIMEEYGQWGGLIVYRTHVGPAALLGGANLTLGEPVHDHATVLINGKRVGALDRNGSPGLTLPGFQGDLESSSATLDIAVEALGRSNEGWRWDVKGLPSPAVLLDGQALTNWTAFPLPLDNVQDLGTGHDLDADPGSNGPVFYRGSLQIDGSLRGQGGLLPDSYLAVHAWGKGLAFVNGFNLGWYWPLVGPANTLYVPGAVLQPGANSVILLEIERAPADHAVSLESEPDFYGPRAQQDWHKQLQRTQ